MTANSGKMAWGRRAIVLSIALNVFLIAFIGVQIWRYRDPTGFLSLATTRSFASGEIAQTLIARLSDRLPPQDAALLRQAFVARLPDLVRLQRQSFEAVEQVRRDVGEPSYDDAKVRADMDSARASAQKIRPVVEEILLDVLPRMSPEGRKALSEIRLLPRK